MTPFRPIPRGGLTALSHWPQLLALFLLPLISLLVYQGALDNEFTWDSLQYVPNNPRIQTLDAESAWWALTTDYFANWHPATWLSYMLDYQIYGGYDTQGFHLTNILLHAANVVLFFLLAHRLIDRHFALALPSRHIHPTAGAFCAALLFAIHPQHVESVAWVAERKDVLFLFFLLASLLLYIHYVTQPSISRYSATLLFAILAMAAKPMAVSLPIIILLLDIHPLHRLNLSGHLGSWIRRKQNMIILAEKLPFAVFAIITVILTLRAQSVGMNTTLEWSQRIGGAASAYFSYIAKLFFPIHLVPLYPREPLPPFSSHLPPLASFVTATLLCLYFWHRGARWWLVGWIYYVITLLPTVGLITVGFQSTADRYAYLPMLVFYVFIGAALGLHFSNPKQRTIIGVAVLLASVLLAQKTATQIRVWRNEQSLWEHIAAANPDHPLAIERLANIHYVQRDYRSSLVYFQKLLEDGNFYNPMFARYALATLRSGHLEQALDIYQRLASSQIPTGIPLDCLHYNIAWIHTVRGEIAKSQSALDKLSYPKQFPDLNTQLRTSKGKPGNMPPLCQKDPYGEAILHSINHNALLPKP